MGELVYNNIVIKFNFKSIYLKLRKPNGYLYFDFHQWIKTQTFVIKKCKLQ